MTTNTRELLDRLHLALVTEIENTHPDYLWEAFTVAEIYKNLVPYRSHRDVIGVEMNGDYEHALLRLLAGEGDYLILESDAARQAIVQELASPNPNTGLFREFAAANVRLNPARLDALVHGESDVQPELPGIEPDTAAPAPLEAELGDIQTDEGTADPLDARVEGLVWGEGSGPIEARVQFGPTPDVEIESEESVELQQPEADPRDVWVEPSAPAAENPSAPAPEASVFGVEPPGGFEEAPGLADPWSPVPVSGAPELESRPHVEPEVEAVTSEATDISLSRIVGILEEELLGATPTDIGHRYGVTQDQLDRWRARYGGFVGLGAQVALLTEENRRLKLLVADQLLELEALRQRQAGGD